MLLTVRNKSGKLIAQYQDFTGSPQIGYSLTLANIDVEAKTPKRVKTFKIIAAEVSIVKLTSFESDNVIAESLILTVE